MRFYRKIRTFFFLGFMVGALGACSVTTKHEELNPEPLPGELSLVKDRKELEALRKDVPAVVQRENDESAFMLDLMGTVKQHPSVVRDKFNQVSRKKREKFQKDNQVKRETFRKKEMTERQEFLKKQNELKEEFKSQKQTREDSRAFYDKLDVERREFFSTERSARQTFESELRDQQKEFENYYREKQGEFNQRHREYTEKYRELQKQKRDQSLKINPAAGDIRAINSVPSSQRLSNSDDQQLLEEFTKIPQEPGVLIETE